MLLVKRAGALKDAGDITIELGRGAVAIARRLDAFEAGHALALARADLNALLMGEEPAHAWTFNEERLAILRASDEAQQIALGWMRNVLVAMMSVHTLTGIDLKLENEEGEEIGREPMQPGFEAFELLFHDAMVESRFRMSALRVETLWLEEKNGSRLAQHGRGPEDLNSAPDANETKSHAHQAADRDTSLPALETPPGAEAIAARLEQTQPEAPKASSLGSSDATAETGNGQASPVAPSG